MSGPQWILVSLVAITTLGAWGAAASERDYRFTPDRIFLALLAPFFWVVAIVWIPWGEWLDFKPSFAPSWSELLNLISTFVGTLFLFVVAPAWFVMSLVIWIVGALTGNLLAWIFEPLFRKLVGKLKR